MGIQKSLERRLELSKHMKELIKQSKRIEKQTHLLKNVDTSRLAGLKKDTPEFSQETLESVIKNLDK